MTWLEAIAAILRPVFINRASTAVATDIVTNGLTPADEAVIDAFLATTMP